VPLNSPPPDETFTLALITSLKTGEVGLVRHSTTVKTRFQHADTLHVAV
jgi:hypothetical protein